MTVGTVRVSPQRSEGPQGKARGKTMEPSPCHIVQAMLDKEMLLGIQ